jgi:hypothetical protein
LRLKNSGAALKVLDSPIGMTSPSGELILHVLGAVAQFEREIMLARQREGITAAKAEGKYKGRRPTVRAHGRNPPPQNIATENTDAVPPPDAVPRMPKPANQGWQRRRGPRVPLTCMASLTAQAIAVYPVRQ